MVQKFLLLTTILFYKLLQSVHGKYKLVDMETGQEYIDKNPGMGEKVMHWKKVE